MTNNPNGTLYVGVLYVGVTTDLEQRVYQHRDATLPGFTSRYGCAPLVWYEQYDDITNAIQRERQIKGGPRKRKLALIEAKNPAWRDLREELL
jgi:putative endonuclease